MNNKPAFITYYMHFQFKVIPFGPIYYSGLYLRIMGSRHPQLKIIGEFND